MPIRHGDSGLKNLMTSLRRSLRRATALPAAATPWTWNQFLARSRPMAVICIADSSSYVWRSATTTLWHTSMPGVGAGHTINLGADFADIFNQHQQAER